jgi:hypothetical protein
MGKPFSSSGMLLVSLLLFVGAAVPTYAQSSTSKIEQLVRAKGKPFKINRVSAEYLEPFRVDVNHVRIHGTIFLVQDLAVLIRRRR